MMEYIELYVINVNGVWPLLGQDLADSRKYTTQINAHI